MLRALLCICTVCANVMPVTVVTSGTGARFKSFCCMCNKSYSWASQSYVGQMMLGNIKLAASMLFPTTTRHMYWVASTSNGNADLVLAKWSSITNHVANKHTRHDNPLYPKCQHGRLDDVDWMKKGKKGIFIMFIC